MSNRNNSIPDNNAASTATGAILGGLIGGPFGCKFFHRARTSFLGIC